MTLLTLTRESLSDFESVTRREWLVTNGLGGFATGSISGANTRRYHGLLIASLRPPLERTVMVAKLDAAASYRGRRLELATNEFADGVVAPKGYVHLESFHLEGIIPVWSWSIGDALLEQRLWMHHGANTTYVQYTLVRGSEPIALELTPLCTYRDYHAHQRGERNTLVMPLTKGIQIDAFWGARPYRVLSERGEFRLAPAWYWNFKHRAESERGLDDVEDLFRPAVFEMTLAVGESGAIVMTADADEPLAARESLARERARQGELLHAVESAVTPKFSATREFSVTPESSVTREFCVTPAKAGAHLKGHKMDPRLRGDDEATLDEVLTASSVTPAKAGAHLKGHKMDPRLRGDDEATLDEVLDASSVTPAEAGAHLKENRMDPRFRGDDGTTLDEVLAASSVTPAKAGAHLEQEKMDPRFRGDDGTDGEDVGDGRYLGEGVDVGEGLDLGQGPDAEHGLDVRGARDDRADPDAVLLNHLALAADQFIVERHTTDPGAGRHTIIAGYPWFSDWGRDTMIALPGLTLTTRRFDIAASVLRTFARFVSDGLLPNRFPDAGEAPEYNTVDATLWYFVAIDEYVRASGDRTLLEDLYPTLRSIIRWHERGARYGIRVDARDGLLRAGEPGVQLTWMDAKIGDWVVTPRIGKPVEINALWCNALAIMRDFSASLRDLEAARHYASAAERAVRSFSERFWYERGGYLYDVVDGPDADDPSLRPNQLFALSLRHALLDNGRAKAVVDVCARELWTPVGLRSLAPDDAQYAGRYVGGPRERDAVYHQGTVWSWLLGPFVRAHYRVYGDAPAARAYLSGVAAHLRDACIGQISEIFDGDAPFAPRGCTAQAWSVAEILKAWSEIHESEAANGRKVRAAAAQV